MIAGLWNNINIDMKEIGLRNIRLIIYKGDSVPNIKNASNYYEWTYTENNPEPWQSQVIYNNYTYIDSSKCEKNGAIYSFYVGVRNTLPKDIFSREQWNIKIYSNNDLVYSDFFWLERATYGLARSRGDNIHFNVDPFTEMQSYGSDYFTFRNTGNVPLKINARYPDFLDFVEFINFESHMSPKKNYNFELLVNSGSWQPQRIIREGTISAEVPGDYIIDDDDAMVYLKTAFKLDLPVLRVFVGHSGYELEDILDTGLTFQYKKNVQMYEGEIIDLNAYVSGDGTINLDIWTNDTKNIRILKIFKNDVEITSPFDIISTSTEEQHIVVRVEAIREGQTGDINYDFKTDTGRRANYQTRIIIGPPQEPEKDDSSEKTHLTFGSNTLITGIVVISVLAAIIYMFFSQIKHKRR